MLGVGGKGVERGEAQTKDKSCEIKGEGRRGDGAKGEKTKLVSGIRDRAASHFI